MFYTIINLKGITMHKGRPCGRKAGMKFGLLTLLTSESRPAKNGTRRFWQCKCDCGNLVERRDDYLKSFPDNNFSCGCNHSMKTLGNRNINWAGHGDISGMYFAGVRCSARNRGIDFNITIEDAWEQFEAQNRECALTKLPLVIRQSIRMKTEMTASLDRIDSSKGYTKDNIQWVHKDVNKMKNGYTEERFKEICRLVTEHSSKCV